MPRKFYLCSTLLSGGITHYTAQLSKFSFQPSDLGALVAGYLPTMMGFGEAYVEEMRGIAKGAGVSFEEIALLNARTEILKVAQHSALNKSVDDTPDGCTGVIVMPDATQDGRLIHGLNWDWKDECAESTVVLLIHRDDGPDILTMTEAGALARAGMNASGVTLTGNYLECERDYRNVGAPIALVRRKALECAHFAQAIQVICTTAKSASSNMMLGHGAGLGINFECAPDEPFQLLPENGLLIHANHWISIPARCKLVEKGIAAMPDTLYRDVRVRELLNPQVGSIGTQDVKAALGDDMLTPWSVCRPPRPNPAGVITSTVATLIMQPELGTMDVAVQPALGGQFKQYSLTPESTAKRRAAEHVLERG